MKNKHLGTTLIIGVMAGVFGGLVVGPIAGLLIFVIAVSSIEYRNLAEELEVLRGGDANTCNTGRGSNTTCNTGRGSNTTCSAGRGTNSTSTAGSATAANNHNK